MPHIHAMARETHFHVHKLAANVASSSFSSVLPFCALSFNANAIKLLLRCSAESNTISILRSRTDL